MRLMLLARAELFVSRLLRFLVGSVMLSAVLINVANVVGRYVFLHPFIWAEEVMQFLNIWVVMLGAAIVTRSGTHLKMDAMYNVTSPRGRRILDALANVLGVAVSVYVVVQSVQMIQMLAATGQRSVIARAPMNLMYAAIPLGFGCSIFFLSVWLLNFRRRRAAAELSASTEIAG